MSQQITTLDPEFDKVKQQFEELMRDMGSAQLTRAKRSEESFRVFAANLLYVIAQSLGFVVSNLVEFVKDMKWSLATGWAEGIQRARDRSVRPHD